MKPPRRSTVSPCPELPWFGHERHAPAGLLARGSLRRCPASQDNPSGCGRWAAWTYARRSQLQGQPSSKLAPFAAFPFNPFGHRCVSSETQNEVSLESFLNHFDDVKNRVRTHMRVPNGVPISDCGNKIAQRTASLRRSVEQRGKGKIYFAALAVFPNTAPTPAFPHFSPSPLDNPPHPDISPSFLL